MRKRAIIATAITAGLIATIGGVAYAATGTGEQLCAKPGTRVTYHAKKCSGSYTPIAVAGTQGPAGVAGPVGPQGPKGDQGPAGPSGIAITHKFVKLDANFPASSDTSIKYLTAPSCYTNAVNETFSTADSGCYLVEMADAPALKNGQHELWFSTSGDNVWAPDATVTVIRKVASSQNQTTRKFVMATTDDNNIMKKASDLFGNGNKSFTLDISLMSVTG